MKPIKIKEILTNSISTLANNLSDFLSNPSKDTASVSTFIQQRNKRSSEAMEYIFRQKHIIFSILMLCMI